MTLGQNQNKVHKLQKQYFPPVLFCDARARTAYRHLFQSAGKFCENQLKVCCPNATMRHAYQLASFCFQNALLCKLTKWLNKACTTCEMAMDWCC